ncbi:hypothetical protein OPV22_007756 [Ensete ventricosum]|uniref:Sodium/calcium exchanger membrane region domain-containing protein n=1 Tax=Ensete ventricosum TaxID=4639 RepID=A0AAV8RTM1_ENSVE|nr:hypothetical protein OPV22_007756 [Ensete ventricosum]
MVGGDPSTMSPCSCGNLENGPFTGNLTLLVLHAARRPAPSSTVSRPPVSLEIPSDFHAGIPRRRPSPAREAVWTPKMITLSEAMLTVLQFGLLLVHAYVQDKQWPYLSIPLGRSDRPEEWVPENETLLINGHDTRESNDNCCEIPQVSEGQESNKVDIFSIHLSKGTGINSYVIAFTALASGTSWPDLVASKIAAERQITADSAIANITCSRRHFFLEAASHLFPSPPPPPFHLHRRKSHGLRGRRGPPAAADRVRHTRHPRLPQARIVVE